MLLAYFLYIYIYSRHDGWLIFDCIQAIKHSHSQRHHNTITNRVEEYTIYMYNTSPIRRQTINPSKCAWARIAPTRAHDSSIIETMFRCYSGMCEWYSAVEWTSGPAADQASSGHLIYNIYSAHGQVMILQARFQRYILIIANELNIVQRRVQA